MTKEELRRKTSESKLTHAGIKQMKKIHQEIMKKKEQGLIL